MAYENKTVDYVYNLLIESFQEKFNNRLRLLPKSFIVILSKVLSVIFVLPYKVCGWFYLQLFPDTASFDRVNVLGISLQPLVKLGVNIGVGEPTSGQAWEGLVLATVVTEGEAITAGTQLKSDVTGLMYVVSETVTTEGEAVEVPVYCVQSGSAGNLSEGDEIKFVSPLGFIVQDAVVSETTKEGLDEETAEHYRARVVNRYSTQPQGGALSDYRIWSYDAPGVLQTYPYNGENSPGDVEIYVAGNTDVYPDRVPGRELCVAVGEACTYDPETGIADRKPMTAILDPSYDGTYLNIKPVSIVTVDVYVTQVQGVDISDFGAAFKSVCNDYLLGREPYIRGLSDDNNKTNSIQRNTLIALANSVATSLKAQFGTVTMEIHALQVENYLLGKGELSALGRLYVNGVEYEQV